MEALGLALSGAASADRFACSGADHRRPRHVVLRWRSTTGTAWFHDTHVLLLITKIITIRVPTRTNKAPHTLRLEAPFYRKAS